MFTVYPLAEKIGACSYPLQSPLVLLFPYRNGISHFNYAEMYRFCLGHERHERDMAAVMYSLTHNAWSAIEVKTFPKIGVIYDF